MIDDKNIPLPIMDILRKAYIAVLNNVKSWLIFSYILAVPIYLISRYLPEPAIEPMNFDYQSLVFYVAISVIILVVINIFFYRIFMLEKGELFKINTSELLSVFFKMTAYILALLCVLFLAILTLVLLFGLFVTIIQAVFGETALSEAISTTVVNLSMLIVMLLITMRVQPTFISLALNKAVLPMKSAYFYTRDNNKELILIGLFSFIPAMLPSTAALMIIENFTASEATINLVAYLLFPLLLLPNIMIMSSGAQIYKYLVPTGPDDKNHRMDITA
tara:strand:+ start:329316 stop:330143 length:828 start_codon:yes stop_codon:yes gene_type:complete